MDETSGKYLENCNLVKCGLDDVIFPLLPLGCKCFFWRVDNPVNKQLTHGCLLADNAPTN